MKDLSTFFMVAGEASGDSHGSALMRALKQQHEGCIFEGVGGPRMREEGLDTFIPMEELQVMGLTEILRQLPKLIKQFYYLANTILQRRPSVVILIDYPGFNLRLAKHLRRRGYQGKIVQYISPTIWAWGKRRLKVMEKNLDLVLTIYPFEAPYFAHSSLEAYYVGNPTFEEIYQHTYQPQWQSQCGLPAHTPFIGLFPGSRPNEITRHFPKLLQAAEQLHREHPDLPFAVCYSHPDHLPLLQQLLNNSGLRENQELFFVPFEFRFELMQSCLCALAKSGTVTLELALHQVPTVVGFTMSKWNYWFAKYLLRLRLPHYSIVNILAQQEVFPEHLVHQFEPKNLITSAQRFLLNEGDKKLCIQQCKKIHQQLGPLSPSQTAAKYILKRG